MKKLLASTIIICMSFQLSGCGSLRPSHRDVERLLVMETIGLDRRPGGVLVSLASAAESSEGGETTPPVRLSATGDSISAAIERMHTHSTGRDLFCAHTTHILVGERSARTSVEPILAYLCRSPDMRLDVPVFIVRGETAETAVKCAGDDKQGITELLSSAQDNLELRGGGRIFPAAEVLRDVERYGGALMCALECTPAEKGGSVQEGCSIALAGYGVLVGWSLGAFISREDALGVDFIKNDIDVCDIAVETPSGPMTLEISGGGSAVSPVWDGSGRLSGLDIHADVSASVMEITAMDGTLDNDAVIALLEKAVSERISAALQLSRKLGADFLGLAGRVEAAAPYRYGSMEESFAQLLPALSFRVTVTGKLSHTNDIKGT